MRLNLRNMLTLIPATMYLAGTARACSVCYGAEGDPQTAGMNGAILTLLGVTGVVAAGMALLFLRILRRARLAESFGQAPVQEADPPMAAES